MVGSIKLNHIKGESFVCITNKLSFLSVGSENHIYLALKWYLLHLPP